MRNNTVIIVRVDLGPGQSWAVPQDRMVRLVRGGFVYWYDGRTGIQPVDSYHTGWYLLPGVSLAHLTNQNAVQVFA